MLDLSAETFIVKRLECFDSLAYCRPGYCWTWGDSVPLIPAPGIATVAFIRQQPRGLLPRLFRLFYLDLRVPDDGLRDSSDPLRVDPLSIQPGVALTRPPQQWLPALADTVHRFAACQTRKFLEGLAWQQNNHCRQHGYECGEFAPPQAIPILGFAPWSA